MNNLDDFEKYLRDQLKGHAEPEPLMWNRLTDAIGRATPWYTRSAFKYAFTAIGAMVFGAVSSYVYLEQHQTKAAISKQTQTQQQIESPSASTSNSVSANSSGSSSGSASASTSGSLAASPQQSIANSTKGSLVNGNVKVRLEAFPNVLVASLRNDSIKTEVVNPIESKHTDRALPLLAAGKIKLPLQTIQNRPQVLPLAGRFELSIATGNTWSNLPSFEYQLGPQGMQHAASRQQQSPMLTLQARIYKNWHLQTGIQMSQTTLEEHFYHTDVYSFDDEQHYLFPYLYGFRQVSDEELHEGPWPYGPNIPVGPEISKVKANYTSVLNQHKLVLPFTLSYHQQFGPFEAQLHAGLAFSFATKTSQTLAVAGYLPSTIYLHAQNGRLQTFAQSQVRLSYKANRHLSIFVEPQVRSSIQQQYLVHASPYRSNSKALFAGLSWNF